MDTRFPAPPDPQLPPPAERVWLEFRVVLDALAPSARVTFMLHDVFGATLEEVSTVLRLPPEACVELLALARTCVREHAANLANRARPS